MFEMKHGFGSTITGCGKGRKQIGLVEGCRKNKLTNHSLSLIILGIEVGTKKRRAHMIKNISKYPTWHR